MDKGEKNERRVALLTRVLLQESPLRRRWTNASRSLSFCGNILLTRKWSAFSGDSAPSLLSQTKITSLHMASFHGMNTIVDQLIQNGFNPNIRAFDDWTPVHVAAQAGYETVLQILLHAGGSPDAVKSNQVTPLFLAAEKGNLEVIKALFEVKPDLDPAPVTASGQTPLHVAAKLGHEDVFLFLQRAKPDVPQDQDGLLPIHLAALNGRLSIVNLLSGSSSLSVATKWDGCQSILPHFEVTLRSSKFSYSLKQVLKQKLGTCRPRWTVQSKILLLHSTAPR